MFLKKKMMHLPHKPCINTTKCTFLGVEKDRAAIVEYWAYKWNLSSEDLQIAVRFCSAQKEPRCWIPTRVAIRDNDRIASGWFGSWFNLERNALLRVTNRMH